VNRVLEEWNFKSLAPEIVYVERQVVDSTARVAPSGMRPDVTMQARASSAEPDPVNSVVGKRPSHKVAGTRTTSSGSSFDGAKFCERGFEGGRLRLNEALQVEWILF
jgi:hypothetical protein